jgi:cytochrome c-type biogenesis protein CcmE
VKVTTTGRKLVIGGLVLAGATAYMAYLAASASWQYYLTVDECLADAESLVGQRVRVSGKVASDSLRVAANRKEADFLLQGAEGNLHVICAGPLPDNLAENTEVVVEGHLEKPGLFRADRLLTRCASKYESQGSPATAESTAAAGPEGGR